VLALASSAPAETPSPDALPRVEAVVRVEKFGTFVLRFHAAIAPNQTANFLRLADEGFFDGLPFHRVVPRFLVQTGNPDFREGGGDGTGGPGYFLPPEPNDIPHTRGAVAMARRDGKDGTAGSQWFVCLLDNPGLDDRSTVFAWVAEGMDTLDRVAQVSTDRKRVPLKPVRVLSVDLREIPPQTP
jgi:peptidyl-prolyl cis-trans isomerase B (cyclophilin B)